MAKVDEYGKKTSMVTKDEYGKNTKYGKKTSTATKNEYVVSRTYYWF